MNKLIAILIVLFVVGCGSPNTLMDELDKSEFNAQEKQDIVSLVQFFESHISIDGKTRSESYEIFLKEQYNDFHAITDKILIKDQRKFLLDLEKSTYDEIWNEGKGRIFGTGEGVVYEEPIPYVTFHPFISGKYFHFLKNIGKDYPRVEYYADKTGDAGDFIELFGILADQNASFLENLDDGHWRIIIAIQMLTINEQHSRFSEAQVGHEGTRVFDINKNGSFEKVGGV